MKPAESRPPFLVMAHHRSGSNFLNDLLQQHAAIECLNEPLSMHTSFFREHDLVPWHTHDYDPSVLHASLAGDARMREFLLELRHYLRQSRRGRILGFKDTCLFGKLGWLKAFIPELRIIFLRRDPKSIVSSVMRSELATLWRYADLVPPAFAAVCPGYVSRVDAGDAATQTAELAAKSVAVRYEWASRTIGLFEHLTLDLENISRQPAHAVRALSAFLGAETDIQQASFVVARQSLSRGGLFSSFRSIEDVEQAWRRHLSQRQASVIEDVMRAVPGEGAQGGQPRGAPEALAMGSGPRGNGPFVDPTRITDEPGAGT
jgi:hypothetical protein